MSVFTSLLSVILSAALSAQAQVADPALRKFVEQVSREWPGESEQQFITVTSLRLMTDALEALGHGPDNTILMRDLGDLRRMTAEYERGTPGSLQQSKQLRRTLIRASQIVERAVRNARRAEKQDPRLSAMERAARSLDDDAPLRRQPDVIERFFRHAAEALTRLDATSLPGM